MRRRLTLCFVLLAMVSVAACASPSRVNFIPEGGSYTAESIASALDASEPGRTAKVETAEAPSVRQESLADLRTNGDDAAALADVLTSEFPTDVAAVPYTVEKGTYEGEPAWIVYEAWGDAGGSLSYRRIWVFAYDDKAVLAAHSVR